MKTSEKIYESPQIEMIILDHEISLVLNSDPPFGPDEGPYSQAPDYLSHDPFDTTIG
jgi:hypothetical protein